jgi:parvulin-like peptidyl-prolyl isomerase
MATKKKIIKRKAKKVVDVAEVDLPQNDIVETSNFSPTNVPTANKKNMTYGAIIVVIVLAFILLFKNGLIVAATVNGKPIFAWDFYGTMAKRFGKQTLEGMITENLIDSEAVKAGVSLSQNDITARENQIVKSFGGNVSIDELLKYQGMTKADFDDQIKLQMQVEKILGKDMKFSDNEVENYISTNSGKFTSTDAATMKEEARTALTQAAVSAKVQTWFADIRKNAKVTQFFNSGN